VVIHPDALGAPTRWRPPGPLGLGGAPLGNLFAPVAEDVADATVEAAWQGGMRCFDTAPLYGLGLSERRIGRVLRGKPRDSFAICTKVGRMLESGTDLAHVRNRLVDGQPLEVRFDYTADAALRSIEGSLVRLELGRVEIALIHDPAEDTHGAAWRDRFEEAMRGAAVALTRLREEGVIRAWGLGTNRVEPCMLAPERTDPDIFLLAGRHSLLDHAAAARLFPACAATGASVLVGGPYNSGLLAGGDTFDYRAAPPAMIARRDAIAAVCALHGVPLKAAALHFCAAAPEISCVVSGARTPTEAAENALLMAGTIPLALWADLRERGLLAADAPVPV
jgi:D-threo-aldose 1-dehydrogenase